MHESLESALRQNSLTPLGCEGETLVDGIRYFNFGAEPLGPWATLTEEQQDNLVYDLLDWNDMFQSDEKDLRSVLTKVMR